MASRLIWNGDEIERQVTAATKAAVDETTSATAARAKNSAPKRTGELASSIRSTPAVEAGGAVTGSVGAGATHSLFVELGTSKMRAQPYLRPSADAENKKLAARIKARMR